MLCISVLCILVNLVVSPVGSLIVAYWLYYVGAIVLYYVGPVVLYLVFILLYVSMNGKGLLHPKIILVFLSLLTLPPLSYADDIFTAVVPLSDHLSLSAYDPLASTFLSPWEMQTLPTKTLNPTA